jgi:hypothetical protein
MNINIPQQLDDITVEQYQKFDKANSSDDKEFVLHKLISIFCNIPMKEVLNIRLEDAEEVSKDVMDVLEQESSFTKTFEHKGVNYGFIPNLDDITMGEYIDLDTYLRDTATMHRAMAVLYRPITKQYKELYSIEKYDGGKDSETFKSMPLGIATAALVFFYRLGNELTLASSLFSVEAMKATIQERRNSPESTDGLLAFTSLAEVMLQGLKRSQNSL